MSAISREQVLAAFGITEEDMAALKALEDANGYTASKARYEAELAAYREAVLRLLRTETP